MRLKSTPIEVMRGLISAHLKKRAGDDETATMLAIKPAMTNFFGEQASDLLLHDRVFKDHFYTLRAAQAGPVDCPNHPPQARPQTLEII